MRLNCAANRASSPGTPHSARFFSIQKSISCKSRRAFCKIILIIHRTPTTTCGCSLAIRWRMRGKHRFAINANKPENKHRKRLSKTVHTIRWLDEAFYMENRRKNQCGPAGFLHRRMQWPIVTIVYICKVPCSVWYVHSSRRQGAASHFFGSAREAYCACKH